MTRIAYLALTLAALSLVTEACTDKSTGERCDELLSYIEGRALIDDQCMYDSQCHVIYIRPDQPIAGRVQPDDPELDAALRRYRDTGCGVMPRFEGEVYAVCEPSPIDLDQPDVGDPAHVEERYCVLRGEVPPPDVGFDVQYDRDVLACDCVVDADCGEGQVCACQCVDASPCGLACANVYACGEMASLGFGRTGENCVASCAAQDDSSAGLAECLAGAACDAIVGCLR